MKNNFLIIAVISITFILGCRNKSANAQSEKVEGVLMDITGLQKATFGSGCFWCTEAVFEELMNLLHSANETLIPIHFTCKTSIKL